MAITLRPIEDTDLEFLFQVYASTRLEELRPLNWSKAQLEAFLNQQFFAQHHYYQENYKTAQFELILEDGQAIGRLYVDRGADEIRLIDIALLPQYRNRGLGTQLLKDLLAEAQAQNLPIRIHVEQFNPALRLYQRLGFQLLEDKGIYYFMEWRNAG